ncbi:MULTISPECIES: thioredoxin fold domain-containing protein [unclassified Sphingobacterium]|uniref:thioredoxin family protein n=1 Tax=unclassified Sphingobacterium TaxID=2609468 RepID=UPI0010E8537A|nr:MULTISPECIES: thioredoxin fold domain-containing protein [unclassified Sphingobacterium]MCS3556142.1 thioredoxin-related protein [Sphingobacterium sp. JUb21]TCR08518.1 thioredoxin-like protein [Sphingobacterium sp. JUb20]
MKTLFFVLFFLPSLFVMSQEKGVHFEHKLTWDQIKAKAQAENKYIFVDCFTTWCGPCKTMTAKVFPQEKVGNVLNSNFISVKLQMDQTKNDSEEVKSWYDDAKKIAAEHKIAAFPTFLVFGPNGKLVHRWVGGSDADEFIKSIEESMNPETQYITLVEKYQEGNVDLDLSLRTMKASYDARNKQLAKQIINDIGFDKLLTSKYFSYLIHQIDSAESPALKVLKNEPKIAERLFKENEQARKELNNVLFYSVIKPGLEVKEGIDFDKFRKKFEQEYPFAHESQSIRLIACQYYNKTKNFPALKDAVQEFLTIKDEDQKIHDSHLYIYVQSINEHCIDVDCIKAALGWTKLLLSREHASAQYMSTYASLLYKSGEKTKAMDWMQKAIENSKDAEKEAYIVSLNRLKAGQSI